ncbi:ependymin-like [Polymixia lowei]
MRSPVLLMCLAVGCLAQTPHPCKSPPLMTGSLTVSTQNEKFVAYARYMYDAFGKRIRFKEIGSYENRTFDVDALLLFRERVVYKIDYRDRSCCKKRLGGHFHPMVIPKNASLLGQAVLGSSSGPGQGLLVNTWHGELEGEEIDKYMITFTEFGCIPVSALHHTDKFGWVLTSFFNNVLGIEDPGQFIPPPFCEGVQLDEDDEEPANFYSMFF